MVAQAGNASPRQRRSLTFGLAFKIPHSIRDQHRARRVPPRPPRHRKHPVSETVTSSEMIALAADPVPSEPAAAPVTFADLGLSEPILRAVIEKGYTTPTPIQAQAIPVVLMGRDVLGSAQTGTGKTAGFTLPLIDILAGSRGRARMPRALILEPTRELALQVAENFVAYGKYTRLTHALVIGGESMTDQRDVLTRGVDVVIATPGRLIDMFERGTLLLTDVKVLVIDEADRMLDMGFIPDVERIVSMLQRTRQPLLFSATIAPEIRRRADAFLQNPKQISVSPPASVASTITSRYTLVAEHDKREALRRLIRAEDVQNALIFCNRKRDVDILFRSLTRHNFKAGALHGDMTQPMRFATLEKFKAGEIQLLVCSDVAARGLDIGGLSHVFNFDVPHHAEDYVHRIGRTGRAGREGRAFTLATPEDRLAMAAIETLTAGAIQRMQIEGLDTVEWSEAASGRRGRRGSPARGGKAGSNAGRGARAASEKPPAARRGRKASGEAPPAAASPHEPGSPAPSREHSPAPSREHSPAPSRDRSPAPSRDRSPAPSRDRSPASSREVRAERAAGNDRQTVVGFGVDVPAFMLVAARPNRGAGTAPPTAEGPQGEGGASPASEIA